MRESKDKKEEDVITDNEQKYKDEKDLNKVTPSKEGKKKDYNTIKKSKPDKVTKFHKILFVILIACILGYGFSSAVDSAITKSAPIVASMDYGNFKKAVESKKVKSATVDLTSMLVNIELEDGKKETVLRPTKEGFLEYLGENDVDIKIVPSNFSAELSSNLVSMLTVGLSILLTLIMIFYFFKMASMLKGKVSDGSNGKQVEVTDENRVTFADVAGLSEEKAELQDAIMSIKKGAELKKRGSRPIKGVLLEGDPGVGKTLLAKAIAGEAGVPFYSFNGSSFTEMFVGLGAMRVRKMFDEAIKNAPCVIFIDELDALGGKRSNSPIGGNSERENTLISMLDKMDGMEQLDGVLVVGATNRVDVLDDALVRPGRFDKIIHISKPRSREDREAIVKVHLRNKTLAEGVSVETITKEFFGFSGAEIESALNDAVLESFRDGKDGVIDLSHISKAVAKLLMKGLAKGKNTGECRERIAIHEAGHAMVYKHLGKPLVKVTIQPYSGGVGGFTQVDNEATFKPMMTKQDFIDDIKVLYGGMVAEEVLLGSASTGASNDLMRATQLIDKMQSSFGLVDDSLIVTSVLNNNIVGNSVSDNYVEKLEKIARGIKKELVELFNREDFRSELISLKEELLDKETIYFNAPDIDKK